ncbi:hypothetical protein [Promicromonospora iranensis]|nr:hypothetical protein [Promicromonospora iranensis]
MNDQAERTRPNTALVAYTVGTDFKPGSRTDTQDFTHWHRW